jgi:hypothetical protein
LCDGIALQVSSLPNMVIMDEIGDQVLQTETLVYTSVTQRCDLFVLLFEELGEF